MRQRTEIGITTGWKRRSPGLERGLTVTAACFIVSCIAPAVSVAELLANSSSCIGEDCAAAGVGGSNDRSQEIPNISKHGGNGNTCLTAVCNDTATMILNNMDRSVEPCDNFYRYVCGGFLNSTTIRADGHEKTPFPNTQRLLYEQLRAIVEAKIEPNEPRAYQLVKKYYKSCMNESAIEARGVQPLLASLRRIGGAPVFEGPSWNESNFDWTKAIYKLRETGHEFQLFINFTVAEDNVDHTKHAIYIIPPNGVHFDDSDTNVIGNEILATFVDRTLDIAMSLGVQNNTVIQEEIEEAVMFGFNLTTIPISKITLNNTSATRMTLTELKRNYPSIPWQGYICKMLPSTVSIPVDEVMIVQMPIYFNRLDKLLSNTSKRVLANYIALTTVLQSIQYLNREMVEKARQLSISMPSTRREMCTKRAISLSFAIESMYVSRHLSADSKSNVTAIMDDVRKAVRDLLETASWLDNITKSRALQKLDTMGAYINHADQPSNDTLDKIYESLEIDENHYYENSLKVSLFDVDYSLRKLRQPVGKRGPNFKITDATAEYWSETNNFALTPGILQNKYFGSDRPRFMNYGAIGSIIGHEITHAFDSDGRRYNENGDNVNWWQPSSDKEFSKRAECIVDQYSNYTIQEIGLRVNGTITLDENIADIGGLKAAYRAYNKWVGKHGEEPKLPGIDMTPYQLFWTSTATMYCTKSGIHHLLLRLFNEDHSLPEFRIIGSMSNIPEFAKDFKCPVGSNMNPSKKCPFW